MKNLNKYLNNNKGFVFIILILIIIGLGSLGLALAASTVSNIQAHKSIQRLEHDFYGTDGSMTHVQAILERACAYGRYNAQKAADEAYEYGMESDVPLTNDELFDIYKNSFDYYITTGRGKTYINEKLDEMQDDPIYKVDATPLWSELTYDVNGINIKVNSKKLLRNEKLSAVFNMPYNYILDAEKEITITRDNPAGAGTMPVGYYNPLFRSALTMSSNITLNGSGNLYVDSSNSTSKIAMQWTNGLASGLVYTDAKIEIFGTTTPALERDGANTLTGNSHEFYVNGVKTDRTTMSEASKRVNLTEYYNSGYMSSIVTNKNDELNSYFEAVEGDLVLRIYTGNVFIDPGKIAGQEWKSLSGKRGLIIIAGSLTTNSNVNITSPFTGGILVLGSGNSRLDSSLKLAYNEEAIMQAINLYRKARGSDTVELMFNLNTLMDNTEDPQAVEVVEITGGSLFDAPLTIGNNYMTSSGIKSDVIYPYFRIADKKIYLDDSDICIQSSTGFVNLVSQNNIGLYKGSTLIWDETNSGCNAVKNVGDIFSLIDNDLLKTWKSGGTVSITREKVAHQNYILRLFTQDIEIKNGGKIYVNDKEVESDSTHGRMGFIFVNGRISIDGPYSFEGVIIATNGINAFNSSVVRITHNVEIALEAINLSPYSVQLFKPGAIIKKETISAYTNVKPTIRVNNDALTLFTAPVTLSNVKFMLPYTFATAFSPNTDITLSNSSLNITTTLGSKGLQTTTNNIFLAMGSNTQNSIACDAVTTTLSGTFPSSNTLGPIADAINVNELTTWLNGTQGAISVITDTRALGLFSEGQNFDLSEFNGKSGFIFYNGELNINSDFTFHGVVVATKGISITNGNVNIAYNQEAALDAIALNTTATKIFLDVPASTVSSGTYVGASNSGDINKTMRGVSIVSWHSVR